MSELSFPIDAGAERRAGPDRRRRPTSMLGGFLSPRRRRSFRRASEGVNGYVDLPSPRVVLWALAVMALSAIDALLTLIHIEAGGGELVPTMRVALKYGETTFVVSKMAVTAIGVFFLALHEHFRIARAAIRGLCLIYMALMAYHLALIVLR